MKPYKESIVTKGLQFPVELFIQDNLKMHVCVEPHWHDCFEILYILKGEGKQHINERSFDIEEDDIVIIHNGDIHATYCSKDTDVKILVVKFLPEVINDSYSKVFEWKYILAFLNSSKNNINHLKNASSEYINLHRLLMGLYEESTKMQTGYEMFVIGYIYQLLASMARDKIIDYNDVLAKEKEMHKLEDVIKYIENNYSENLDMKKAAKILNISYSYFSRFFKKVTGKTFKEYVDFVRVCEMEKILISRNISISQAAFEVGFASVSSCNRVFRKIRNYSPINIKKIRQS